jgi:molybdopterin/thiamine biosynthesis adenylyltransferase
MKYYITVIETLKKRVEVEADSEEDALARVEQAYNKCDIILDENDFTDVKFKVKKVIDEEENIEE